VNATLALLARIHGVAAILSALLLSASVALSRERSRRASWVCTLAAAFATGTAALGMILYPAFGRLIRQSLFLEAPRLGYAFERKEHFAAGAVALAWAGLLAFFAARKATDAEARGLLVRTARVGYLTAFVLAASAGVIGALVANHRSF
jgi:hypothetical protein